MGAYHTGDGLGGDLITGCKHPSHWSFLVPGSEGLQLKLLRYQCLCLSSLPHKLRKRVASWNGREQAGCGCHSQHLPCGGSPLPQPALAAFRAPASYQRPGAQLVTPLQDNNLPSPLQKGLIPCPPETQHPRPHVRTGPPAAAPASPREGRHRPFRAQVTNPKG